MDTSFNSLFVGMCFAIHASFHLECHSSNNSFNSLFVGMCFAIILSQRSNGPRGSRFNSLFVGMCFAILYISV